MTQLDPAPSQPGCDYGEHAYEGRTCVHCGSWNSTFDGGTCLCGHAGGCHEPGVKCHGLRLVGPGNEHDGGDYAPCQCREMEMRL